jgi:hypothetical protein
MASPPFVSLNVGGVVHTTARETLMREPSSRLALLARGVLFCPVGPDGLLFIDRSPRFFQTSACGDRRGPQRTRTLCATRQAAVDAVARRGHGGASCMLPQACTQHLVYMAAHAGKAVQDARCTPDRRPACCRLPRAVLNYLRDGWVALPKAPEERRELLQEIRRAGPARRRSGHMRAAHAGLPAGG